MLSAEFLSSMQNIELSECVPMTELLLIAWHGQIKLFYPNRASINS